MDPPLFRRSHHEGSGGSERFPLVSKTVCLEKVDQSGGLSIELTLVEHRSSLPGMFARHLDPTAGELPWAYGWIVNLHAHPTLKQNKAGIWGRYSAIFGLCSDFRIIGMRVVALV